MCGAPICVEKLVLPRKTSKAAASDGSWRISAVPIKMPRGRKTARAIAEKLGNQIGPDKNHVTQFITIYLLAKFGAILRFRAVWSSLGSPVPQTARGSWVQSSDFPLSTMLIFHVGSVAFAVSYAAQNFAGSWNFPAGPARTFSQAAGAAIISGHTVMYLTAWRHGPDFIHLNPRLLVIAVPLMVGCLTHAIFSSFSREEIVPFQDRFSFLFCMTCVLTSGNMFAMSTFLATERGPRDTHPAVTVLRCFLRALRLVDCFSDAIVLCILSERVRPCSSHARAASLAFAGSVRRFNRAQRSCASCSVV